MALGIAVVLGVVILLVMILQFKVNAFVSLLVASIAVGLFAGMPPLDIIGSIQKGMGGTLGFVATVVGLGALFGGMLEYCGGAQAIADFLLQKFGTKNAPLALVLTGFVVAIPVFFDVAFIILVPVIYSLQRQTGKSLLLYGIPLLAGLAITHTFIPPTPGPIAVAEIVGADLGWVILVGFLVGIPTAIISGLWFGKYIGSKIQVTAPEDFDFNKDGKNANVGTTFLIIAVPILLIVFNTLVASGILNHPGYLADYVQLFGHPFSALILANFLAWYFLGSKQGATKQEIYKIGIESLKPAGLIILLTGAGGAFKQILTDTGAGTVLAESLMGLGLPILIFGFVVAALVRVVQGSATVAMITSAGLATSFIELADYTPIDLACIVIAIASGASIFSHVNDSGFWLVGQYLGLSEKQTLSSWSVMTTLLSLSGLIFSSLIYYLT